MDAIVLTSGIAQSDDPLYEFSKGDPKAMMEISGKPMIQWVVDALAGARQVHNVIIVGLSPKNELKCKKPLFYVSNQGKMLPNLTAGVEKSLELNNKSQEVLIVSSHNPALRAGMVDWFIDASRKTQDDLYFGVCKRETFESRYPGAKQSYLNFQDMQVCSASVYVVHIHTITEHGRSVEQLFSDSKNPFRRALPALEEAFFSLFAKQLSLQEIVERLNKRTGVQSRALLWPNAEPCMDVETPAQLEMIRADFAKPLKKSTSKSKTPKKAPARARAKPVKKVTSKARPAPKRTAKSKAKGRK